MKKLFSQRGQSSLEYMMYAVIVLAVIVSMLMYFKRGVQGRWRESADSIGEQFDPRLADGTITTTQTGRTESVIATTDAAGGTYTMRDDTSDMTEVMTGNMTVAAE